MIKQDSRQRWSWRASRFLPPAAILAVVAIIYWPILHGGWLWDDNTEITRNLDLTGHDALWKIWFTPSSPDYFPIKSTVQWIQWQVLGDGSTTGYHLTNLILHALVALLLGRVLVRLGVKTAWWGTLIFAVHPLAVESVAWIAEMKNMLSTAVLLLALLAYLNFEEDRNRWFYIKALAWFSVAMLCKSTVVMLPCFLLLLAWWKRGRLAMRDLKATAPFFVISLVLGLSTIWMQNHRAIGCWDLHMPSWLERVSYAGRAIMFYGVKLLWPTNLIAIYPVWSRTDLLLGGAALAFLAVGIGFAWIKRVSGGRHVLLGLGWFVLNLVPVLGFLPMSFSKIAPVADHFVYLSLVGGVGMFALGLDYLASINNRCFARLASFATAGACFFLLFQSGSYAHVFSSAEEMWQYTVLHNPAAWTAHSNLATILLDQKKTQEAERHARAAVAQNPGFAPAWVVLGNARWQAGNVAEAIEYYTKALSLETDSFEAHFNLANALVQTGQLTAAVDHYESALRISPTAGDAHFNLANVFVSLGQLENASAHYTAVQAIRPEAFEARVNRGNIYAAMGKFRDAIADFEAALAVRPSSADVLFSLADAEAEAGMFSDALQHYEQLLQLEAGNPEIHRSYAVALVKAGRGTEAAQHMQIAARIEASAR